MQLSRGLRPKSSSQFVRNTFLEYFCGDHGHRLVRGSPVLPFADPTLAFVNAGMNQFKGALLGTAKPPGRRVANSQKCVRVGGKHNDLVIVGRDGTHHTFFEMLGNWSFGDYFKKEACCMSWELLTKFYGLPAACLHVTYFGGDAKSGLGPDLETYDIWRTIGVPDERLTAGLARDNFWEMGDTGPCGGCTEIHYVAPSQPPTPENMLELWNLVFIQYERLPSGLLQPLNSCHVDTGMGLERLTAVLQGATSNYDTDLFQPLFRTIEKRSGRPGYEGRYGPDEKLDTAYRILADHSRMITACLADGFIPDQEGKLRGIIRKALTVSHEVFGKEEEVLNDLARVVTETLGGAYPEMVHRLPRVHHIISHEAELLRALRRDMAAECKKLSADNPQLLDLPISECPNLVPAYRRLASSLSTCTNADGELDPAKAWSMCETFGVPPYLAKELAKSLGLHLNEEALESEMMKAKLASRKQMYEDQDSADNLTKLIANLQEENVPATDDSAKYSYCYSFSEKLEFPKQTANIVGLVIDGEVVSSVPVELLAVTTDRIGVILDRTNLYSEEGGQVGDRGVIEILSGPSLHVEDVQRVGEYVVHWVKPQPPFQKELSVNSSCLVSIDEERRKSLMNNHTATHLLNAALKNRLTIADQKSSKVSPEKLRFDFSVYKESLSLQDVLSIENEVKKVILHDVAVERGSVSNEDLPKIESLTMLPGETYPYRRIRILQINSGYFLSREPCCGTHALRTSSLGDFVITNMKSLSSSVKSIVAVTGVQAAEARRNSKILWNKSREMETEVASVLASAERSEKQVEAADNSIGHLVNEVRTLPLLSYVEREKLLDQLAHLRTKLKYSARGSLRNALETEMKQVIADNQLPYLVHLLECCNKLDEIPLQKASKMCPDKPALLFSLKDGVLKARCTVPQALVTSKFSAELWMRPVLKEISADGGPPRGQNPDLVYNMKAKKVPEEKIEKVLQIAKDIVDR